MFTRTMRNVGAGIGLGAAMVLGSGAAAFAFDCINDSRSEQGNAKAGANSQVWFTASVEDFLTFELGLPSGVVECTLDEWLGQGYPATVTIMAGGARGQGGVIAGNNPNQKVVTDGRGIEHLEASYIPVIMPIIEGCSI
ncbi:hypothetical protein ARHIZOSPH14_11530 [Agromyces rhizosphaerae]|uniref:Uncharacterized protein n=1 Tax=Agromyces rhizosphaerae TaxID=88374 RepID=A0A9W6FNW0_9MICO|nr:hypothetical protein [Agromyces rhizosphaerae]GLI26911.1 hypothetical protein ARHIZOSPH14_11530 [Agromyces rhizosphaerae]